MTSKQQVTEIKRAIKPKKIPLQMIVSIVFYLIILFLARLDPNKDEIESIIV